MTAYELGVKAAGLAGDVGRAAGVGGGMGALASTAPIGGPLGLLAAGPSNAYWLASRLGLPGATAGASYMAGRELGNQVVAPAILKPNTVQSGQFKGRQTYLKQ